LLARLTKENILCTTKGLQFARPNIFALITNRELARGSVRMVNLLNIQQTELPALTPEVLSGITLGPLSKDVTGGYLTSYHEQDVQILQHGNYVDPDTHHQQASQVPQNIPCYIFDQQNPPRNYDPVRFGPWESCQVLFVPEIPSKNRGSRE